MEIKTTDKFEVTGGQVVDILNAINLLPPSKVGRLFLELEASFVEQAKLKSPAEEPEKV